MAIAAYAPDGVIVCLPADDISWPVLKRAIDVVGALLALVFLSPLLLLCSILILVRDPGPLLFTQQRLGKDGRLFRCYKFRSMIVNADQVLHTLLSSDARARLEWERLHKLKVDPRITKLGRFLRMSSIDELPQFLNVVKGDMSLVGPRPIVPEEAVRYGRFLRNYLDVKPGLTGLWQVNGRNNTTYRRRIAFDIFYSKNRSIALDLWILGKTVPAILKREGSY